MNSPLIIALSICYIGVLLFVGFTCIVINFITKEKKQ